MFGSKKRLVAVGAMATLLMALGTATALAHRVPACDKPNAPANNPHCQEGHDPGEPGDPGDPGDSVVIIDNDFLDLDILNDVIDATVEVVVGDVLTNNGDILTGDILSGNTVTFEDSLVEVPVTVVAPIIGNELEVEDVLDVCTINHDGPGGTGNGPGDTYNDCDVLDLLGDDHLGLDVMADVFALVSLY